MKGRRAIMLAILLVAAASGWAIPQVTAQESGEAVYRKVADSVVLILVENAAHEDVGQGSGFVIDGGLIVTNAHVARQGTLFVKSGVFKAPCTVQKIDDANDLALLKPAITLSVPALRLQTAAPTSGARAFAIGNPRGLEKTITEGLITGLRTIDGTEVLQMSASISPGSSGGPVVDADGAVIGVAVAGLKNAQNLNFAVPVSALRALLTNGMVSDLPGLLASVSKIATQKGSTKRDSSEGSEWMQLDRREEELLKSAASVASSASDLLRVFDASIDWHSDLALDVATKALAVSKSSATYAAVARAAHIRAYLVISDKEANDRFLQQSLSAAERAVAMSPTTANYYLLADIQEDTAKHNDDALVNFTRAFTGTLPDDKHWDALRGMIRLGRVLKRKTDATSWFSQLAKSPSISDYDWVEDANYLNGNGEFAEAAGIYEALAAKPNQASLTTDFDLWKKAAQSRYFQPDGDSALKDARSCVSAAATKNKPAAQLAIAHQIIAEVLNDRGVYEQAIDAAKQSISQDPSRYGPYCVLSKALSSLERFSEAESAAKTALSLSDGTDSSVDFALGAAYFGQKKWGLAKQAFENAARLDTSDDAAAYNVAVSFFNDRFYREAIPWYQEALRRSPKRKDRDLILARIEELKTR
jgi:tetratricopeptide (TPR) repeat protein